MLCNNNLGAISRNVGYHIIVRALKLLFTNAPTKPNFYVQKHVHIGIDQALSFKEATFFQSRGFCCMFYFSKDVDECTANTHDCHASATCTNTVGSFTCACNQGFTGDGKTCTLTGKFPSDVPTTVINNNT